MASSDPPDLPLENVGPARPMSKVGHLGTAVIISSATLTALVWSMTLWATVADSSDSPGSSTAIFGVILLCIVSMLTYVLTGIWLWRARGNVDLAAPNRQDRPAKAWVWLGWIVPFANFVFPVRVIEDIWRTTNGGVVVRNREAVLTQWRTSYMVFLALSIISNMVTSDVVGFWIDVAGKTAGLVFWIPLVRTLSEAQDALASRTVLTG